MNLKPPYWTVPLLSPPLSTVRILPAPRYLAIAWPYAGIQAARESPWFRAAWPILSRTLHALRIPPLHHDARAVSVGQII